MRRRAQDITRAGWGTRPEKKKKRECDKSETSHQKLFQLPSMKIRFTASKTIVYHQNSMLSIIKYVDYLNLLSSNFFGGLKKIYMYRFLIRVFLSYVLISCFHPILGHPTWLNQRGESIYQTDGSGHIHSFWLLAHFFLFLTCLSSDWLSPWYRYPGAIVLDLEAMH